MRINTKLSTYEIFSLTNIAISMIITNTTPSLIAQTTQNAFWYVPLISFIVVLPSLLILLYLLNKYDAEHFVDLLERLLGKFFGKTIAFIVFLSNFFLLAFDQRSYVSQIKTLYFEQSQLISIFTILTLISIFGAIRGIKVLGYTAKIFLPYFLISLCLLVVLIFPSLIPQQIFPIFGTGLTHVIREGVSKGSIFSKFTLLFMLLPVVRKPKDFYKGALIGLILSVLQIITFFFIYTAFFDYDSIATTPFPFHEMTQYISLGDFFTNIESFFLVFWLASTFIRFILYLYLISWLFGAIFNIKNFELLISPLGFLLMLIGLLPGNMIVTEMVYRNTLFDLTTPIIIIFPLILLISHFIRRIRRRIR